MNISLSKLPVIIVDENSKNNIDEGNVFSLYGEILLMGRRRVFFLSSDNKLPVIIDKLKPLFEITQTGREVYLLPTFQERIIELHQGYERPLRHDEKNSFEVYKIKLFHWILGIPIQFKSTNIIVRQLLKKKLFVSIKEDKINDERKINLNCSIFNPVKICHLILSKWTLASFFEEISNIILKIDRSKVNLADSICLFLNQRGLFPN
jgi:hypothetical protein